MSIMLDEIARLREINDALLAELKAVEWSGLLRESCAACGGTNPEVMGSGHHPDCTLAAAITKAEGVAR